MKDEKVIIKKIKKGHHDEFHGGSWKVAYADFVTAMMAFFLLLWLITMISPEKRARVADYFKNFSIFQQSGSSFMDKSTQMFDESGASASKVDYELTKNFGQSPEVFKAVMKKAIEEKLNDVKDQIMVDVFEGGVRIQLMDKEGRPMFEVGSANPTPLALRILQVITDTIKDMPNPVAIEGHTDALAYKTVNYSNWELSTERALAARKVLEKDGLGHSRISRIAGYADTVPLIKNDKFDPRNRRISIILMYGPKSRG
ncbi:MAG: OmpA family protein [Nitrospiraceae bacterium]|nr:OmpA family protein [Nitrospiraceae bacterium]